MAQLPQWVSVKNCHLPKLDCTIVIYNNLYRPNLYKEKLPIVANFKDSTIAIAITSIELTLRKIHTPSSIA